MCHQLLYHKMLKGMSKVGRARHHSTAVTQVVDNTHIKEIELGSLN